MSRKPISFTSVGLGAALMYLLDPQWGKRRRTQVRDQIVHLWRETREGWRRAARDLDNRARGVVAEARSSVSHERVDDTVLTERARERIGRVVSHPSAIAVDVIQGRARLTGSVLVGEVDRLARKVAAVPGVAGVENHLEVYSEPGEVPELQGAPMGRKMEFELAQENWTPGIRLLAILAGGTLVVTSLMRRGFLGTVGSALGLGMAMRGLANMPVHRLLGLSQEQRGVDIHKTLDIDATVQEVFAFWRSFESFPRFMENVEAVRDLGDGRSHWVVAGPLGTRLQWEAVTTQLVPDRVLAWRTLPDAGVQHTGVVHFTPEPDGGTQVDIRLTYRPPAGAVGHAVASFLGSSPKQQLDADMARFKSLIEMGKTTAHRQKVKREEVLLESGGA